MNRGECVNTENIDGREGTSFPTGGLEVVRRKSALVAKVFFSECVHVCDFILSDPVSSLLALSL